MTDLDDQPIDAGAREALAEAAGTAREALADLRAAHEDRRRYDHAEPDAGPTSTLAAALAGESHVDQGRALASLRAAVTAGAKAVDLGPETTESETVTRLLAVEPDAGTGPVSDARLLAAVREALDPTPQPPRAVTLASVDDDLPRPLVSVANHDGRRDGALLSAGGVLLLAGAGGTLKSTLALRLALEAAATPAGADRAALDGRLVVAGGPVLLATYEDHPAVLRMRAARIAEHLDLPPDAMRAVHVLNLAGWPLFGPAGDGALYGARPGPLSGWAPAWEAMDRTGAKLCVIDPAMAAFTGESNAAAPVREFLGALAGETGRRGAGVLLVAHSTKAARGADASVYDPGHVGGSGHWTDGARGALTLTRRDGGAPVLAIAKSNYGPSFRHVRLQTDGRHVIGTAPGDDWTAGEPKAPQPSNGKPARERDTSADDAV